MENLKNLFLIVAYVKITRAIGNMNELLWKRLKADMDNFVLLTTHNILIVGSKTFATFGKPLKNRLTIIVTRNRNYEPPGVTDENRHLVYVCYSLEEAVAYAKDVANGRNIYIAGGEEIYTEALYNLSFPIDEIIATEVDAGNLEGDKYFPPLPPKQQWKVFAAAPPHDKDEKNEYKFVIKRFRRTAA